MTKATDKQMAYIERLLTETHGSPYISADIRRKYGLTQREARGGMTRGEASRLIDALLAD